VPLNIVNENQVISFLESHIINRFGVPQSLVFDNAKYFPSFKLIEFALEKSIKISCVVSYFPQGNHLAKSTNKNLVRILKNTMTNHQGVDI